GGVEEGVPGEGGTQESQTVCQSEFAPAQPSANASLIETSAAPNMGEEGKKPRRRLSLETSAFLQRSEVKRRRV
ncbi:hypothetical protein Dimus_024871, partial [Dionaea muscipula]